MRQHVGHVGLQICLVTPMCVVAKLKGLCVVAKLKGLLSGSPYNFLTTQMGVTKHV